MASIMFNGQKGNAISIPQFTGRVDVNVKQASWDFDCRRLLSNLATRDNSLRAMALDQISRRVDDWYLGYGSPVEGFMLGKNNGSLFTLPTSTSEKLLCLLPDLERLSTCCPFEDVRKTMKVLVTSLKERDFSVPLCTCRGPSYFIPNSEVVPSDTAEQQIHGLFVDAFVYNCRLEHMIQVMGYHPQYLSAFLAMHHTVLQGADGPLPYDQRHFIGIMASSRHQCSYLVHLQSIEFQLQDGDERWLEGLQCKHIPRKLKNLSELNKLMAHRPWLINKSHIAKLLRGEDSWSLSELMHAVVLLAHFHSLSSFIYGCGISAEVDQQLDAPEVGSPLPADDIKPQSRKGSSASLNDGVNGDVEVLMEQMKKLTEEEQCEEDEVTQEELLQRFNFVESQCAELPASSTHVTQKGDMIRFIDDPEFTYQDFAKCQNAQAIFRAQDYSWEDHGFFQADSLYKDIATLLDEKFKVAFNLTYFTMGDNKHVDTTSFRRAVWYYIQCLFGIRHDDYDYGKISRLLERHLKTYIKIVTCYPETVTNKDYDSFMKGFKHSEKVHVNLMLLEARLQAELLYVLRAITDWQKQRN